MELLVLYHPTPPPPLRIAEWLFTRGVSQVRPDGWLLADDGLLVELPVDSSRVTTRQGGRDPGARRAGPNCPRSNRTLGQRLAESYILA